jgi:hypothetical protein
VMQRRLTRRLQLAAAHVPKEPIGFVRPRTPGYVHHRAANWRVGGS